MLINVTRFSATNLSEQHLALTILYLQEYNDLKAEQHLKNMTEENLTDLLLDNWEVLFDITHLPHRRTKTTMSFSQLGSFLISRCPEVLADILVVLISERKVIGLNKLIKVKDVKGQGVNLFSIAYLSN